ncbi:MULTISPECIES: HpcH/HpaI aldolase/citrate lyase family protein [Amycolatopsis]|uniref:HpcH/HpaI aldolase/citrate lyase family protein n=1 Tax=Amycolatopsis TaxID=1813 RepID=UPI000B8B69B8|nr:MULTISPECIES: CoA ester lyase [Amycolatopsis]OXM72035.1 CoA ester lyase [Amycolatopsis sp. KNN50.9b]
MNEHRDRDFSADFGRIASARTILFVPGDRPDRFGKAATSGADGIVLDLEDAVAPGRKDEARENVRQWRATGGPGLVRVNDATSPWYEDDVAALKDGPCSVVLPKATGPDQVRDLIDRLPEGSCVVPTLETAAGILEARAICSVPGVVRVAFGNGDLAQELGVDHGDHLGLAHARSAVVLASAAAGVAPPLDGVTIAIRDERKLVEDTRHAARLGFTGRMCIHPAQISVIHEVLAPTEEALAWARGVLESATDGASTDVHGNMIDKPIVERARRLLEHG